jgi:hypothetical protein
MMFMRMDEDEEKDDDDDKKNEKVDGTCSRNLKFVITIEVD